HRDNPDLDPRLLFENGKQVLEQAGLLRRSGRGDGDEFLLRERRQDRPQQREQQNPANQFQGNSPLMKASACAVRGLEKNCSTGARSSRRPWSRNRISSPRRRAWPRLWVVMMIFVPAAWMAAMIASTSRVEVGSRLAVGSSRN